MSIHLYNTPSRKREVLVPGDLQGVTMYACGPIGC